MLKGHIEGTDFRGWSGNNSNSAPEDVIQNISIIRTVEDCPLTSVLFQDNENRNKWVNLPFKLTSVLHRLGRCCQAFIPEESYHKIIVGLLVKVYLNHQNSSVNGFQLYLSDQQSATVFHRNKFNVEGVDLEAGVKNLGYIIYDLKIYKEINIENNGKYTCKTYQKFGDYNRVNKSILIDFNNIFLKYILVSPINLSYTDTVSHTLHPSLDYLQ